MTYEEVAQTAYEAYASMFEERADWETLDRVEKAAWGMVAVAVVEKSQSPEDRELTKKDGIERIPGLLIQGVFIARKPPWRPFVREGHKKELQSHG